MYQQWLTTHGRKKKSFPIQYVLLQHDIQKYALLIYSHSSMHRLLAQNKILEAIFANIRQHCIMCWLIEQKPVSRSMWILLMGTNSCHYKSLLHLITVLLPSHCSEKRWPCKDQELWLIVQGVRRSLSLQGHCLSHVDAVAVPFETVQRTAKKKSC